MIKRHLLLDYKSYQKEVTKTLTEISHDVSNHVVVLTFVNNITKEKDIENVSYFADNKSEQMQEVIDTIDGFEYRDGIYPDDVYKDLRKECERYLEEYPLPIEDELEAGDPEIVVSDFECEEINEEEYQLQLTIDDVWYYYPEEDDGLLSRDKVLDIVEHLLGQITSEDTSIIDIVSSLIDYFIDKDLTDYDIIPEGNMYDIEEKLTDLKNELLNNSNEE